MMLLKRLLPLLALWAMFGVSVYAGTGGAEVASWYTDLSAALQGTWGKIIAVVFIGLSLMSFKQGLIVPGLFLVFLGLSVGTIPGIVDSKFTMLL